MLIASFQQYEDIDVWTRVANGTKLRFINSE